MDFKRLVIAKPSGNVTAIVFDDVATKDMRLASEIIQSEYPSVEQVLFVQKRDGKIHGQMAGGEFCGNAARSLGYLLSEGKAGTQSFTMSGMAAPVTVEATPQSAKLHIETEARKEKINLGRAKVDVVHLEGISHAIMTPKHPLFYFLKEYAARPDRWNTVKNVLDDLKLTDQPACGLIFLEGKAPNVSITPYVYVRDIETLYAETACASGSLAVAHHLGKDVAINQPSGEILDVSLRPQNGKLKASINGSMSILWDGPAKRLYGPATVERGTAIETAQASGTTFRSAAKFG